VRVRRDLHVRADGFNFSSAHQDDLVCRRRAFLGIDELASLDCDNAGRHWLRVLRRSSWRRGRQQDD